MLARLGADRITSAPGRGGWRSVRRRIDLDANAGKLARAASRFARRRAGGGAAHRTVICSRYAAQTHSGTAATLPACGTLRAICARSPIGSRCRRRSTTAPALARGAARAHARRSARLQTGRRTPFALALCPSRRGAHLRQTAAYARIIGSPRRASASLRLPGSTATAGAAEDPLLGGDSANRLLSQATLGNGSSVARLALAVAAPAHHASWTPARKRACRPSSAGADGDPRRRAAIHCRRTRQRAISSPAARGE